MASEDWRSATFRQSMIHKIDEQIQQLQLPMMKSANEMENHVFTKSKTKEEYLSFVAKLLMYIKSNGAKKPVSGMMPGGNNMNVLQKAIQGIGQNQQNMGQVGPGGNIASSLLQSLNQRPGQSMNMSGMHNKMQGMGMMQGQQMGMNQMNQMNQMQNMQGGPMMNQMNQMNQGNMGQQMGPQPGQQQQMGGQQMGPNQMQQAMQNQMQNSMGHQLGSPMNPGMQSMQPQHSPLQQQQQQQHMNQMNSAQMNMNQMSQQQLGHMQRKPVEMMNSGYPGTRNMTPNQFSCPSPSVPSPGGLGTPGSNQMVPSPALVPSPNPQHMHGGQRSMAMAPSPNSSLNTPAGMLGGAVASPLQDDQISPACKEKIQKLRKYIDPLNRMIIKLTNEGYTEKMRKMKKLLEILTNPSSSTKLDVLQKCEIVLEKMDFKKLEAGAGPGIPSGVKENQILSPLLEVVGSILQTPMPNHTLHRTFGPCVEALFGPEIKNLPPPLKRRKTEETPSEIPDVLQGEIARLDQRFKISLDPAQQSGSKCIQLICWLDDKYLPCVPPVLVIVPTNYPTVPPKYVLTSHEYATPYLSSVQKGLDARLAKLPKRYSLSQLLDTWEMSVRQACAPTAQQIEDISTTSSPTPELTPSTATSSTNSTNTATTTTTNDISTSLISSAAS